MDEQNWQPTESEIKQLEQMERARQGSAEQRLQPRELTTPDDATVRAHRDLINEFGLPWTIDRLGYYKYAVIARRIGAFNPTQYARRPVLDPCLAPNSPEVVAIANSDRVKTIQEYWEKARRAYAKHSAA